MGCFQFVNDHWKTFLGNENAYDFATNFPSFCFDTYASSDRDVIQYWVLIYEKMYWGARLYIYMVLWFRLCLLLMLTLMLTLSLTTHQ